MDHSPSDLGLDLHVPVSVGGGPLVAYRALVADGALTADDAQRLAAERLQDLWVKLRGYDPPLRPQTSLFSRLLRLRPAEGAPEDHPNGLYLVGEVGRGKSMLMDLFFWPGGHRAQAKDPFPWLHAGGACTHPCLEEDES